MVLKCSKIDLQELSRINYFLFIKKLDSTRYAIGLIMRKEVGRETEKPGKSLDYEIDVKSRLIGPLGRIIIKKTKKKQKETKKNKKVWIMR